MIDVFRNALTGIVPGLRVADLIDVFLVAFLLYVVLTWMRKSMSQSALRGIGVVIAIFAGLYLPARIFEMYMIGRATEILFAILLLTTIVVFQSDLRRMLDRAGTRLFSRRSGAELSDDSTVDLLVEGVATLAETSTGALIAIRGRDPWEHHVQGGVELDGHLSPPLLYSLFDEKTAGHDGALLLEGERVTTFAAHLPLATHLPWASRYGGTRHAAALGLAEVCDAFVIVVSEERGTISVAHEGTLTEVDTAAELKERLGSFWQTHYERATRLREGTWSQRSVQTAVLSVILSTLLWGLFVYSPGNVYRTFQVPIEYRDVPANWRVEGETMTARITLSGPDQAFRAIDPSQLAITFSIDDHREGARDWTVDRRHINLPDQIALERVEPSAIRIETQRLTSVRLPIVVSSRGGVPDSLELIGFQTEPDSVTVLLPQENAYDRVLTEPVFLDSIRATTTLTRTVVRSEDMRFSENGSPSVTVRVMVRPKQTAGGG